MCATYNLTAYGEDGLVCRDVSLAANASMSKAVRFAENIVRRSRQARSCVISKDGVDLCMYWYGAGWRSLDRGDPRWGLKMCRMSALLSIIDIKPKKHLRRLILNSLCLNPVKSVLPANIR